MSEREDEAGSREREDETSLREREDERERGNNEAGL